MRPPQRQILDYQSRIRHREKGRLTETQKNAIRLIGSTLGFVIVGLLMGFLISLYFIDSIRE
jgi:hypothetical protein